MAGDAANLENQQPLAAQQRGVACPRVSGRAGLISPLINTRYRAAELESVLRTTDPRGLALHPGLPLCGAFGFAGAMAALSAGATLVLQAVFEPSKTLELLERHRVTHFYGSDSMLRAVLEAAAGDCRSFESWRWAATQTSADSLSSWSARPRR